MIGWELALSLSLCLCLYKIKSQSQSHKEGVKMDRHRMNFLGLIQAQAPLISPSLLFWLWCQSADARGECRLGLRQHLPRQGTCVLCQPSMSLSRQSRGKQSIPGSTLSPSPGTSLLAGDSGVLDFRTATGGGMGLLVSVAITWPWAFNNNWGVTAWTCRLCAGAGAATLAEFTTHGRVPITWQEIR